MVKDGYGIGFETAYKIPRGVNRKERRIFARFANSIIRSFVNG